MARVAPAATVHADFSIRRLTVEGTADAVGVPGAIAAAGYAERPPEPCGRASGAAG